MNNLCLKLKNFLYLLKRNFKFILIPKNKLIYISNSRFHFANDWIMSKTSSFDLLTKEAFVSFPYAVEKKSIN